MPGERSEGKTRAATIRSVKLPPPGPDSHWLKTAPALGLPACAGEVDCDVLVLGGGHAGVSTAWFLLEGGLDPDRLVLLEAREIAGRASGRNAGFLLADLAEPYHRLREALGEKAARLRRLSLRNQALQQELGERLGFDWQFQADGVLVAAASEHEDRECRESADALRTDGFAVDYLDAVETSRRLGAANAFGSLWDPAGGGSQPAAYVRGVAAACAQRGARLHEHSPATSLRGGGDGGVLVETPHARVRAERVVLALNAYAPLLDPSLSAMVAPFRGQMLSFPPVLPRVLEPVVYRNHGFEYFRQDRAGRFLFGGFRQTAIQDETGYEEAVNPDVQQRLEEFARSLYPQLEGVEPDARWAGTMGFSSDGLPFVGPHPSLSGAVLCLGFTGHGFGLAAEAGRMAAALVLEGRAEDADLFSPRRVL